MIDRNGEVDDLIARRAVYCVLQHITTLAHFKV
jgi:hypothetical protein